MSRKVGKEDKNERTVGRSGGTGSLCEKEEGDDSDGAASTSSSSTLWSRISSACGK